MINADFIDEHSIVCNKVQEKVKEIEKSNNNLKEINYKIEKLMDALNNNAMVGNKPGNIY